MLSSSKNKAEPVVVSRLPLFFGNTDLLVALVLTPTRWSRRSNENATTQNRQNNKHSQGSFSARCGCIFRVLDLLL